MMKKLTADTARALLGRMKENATYGEPTIHEGYTMQALEIALPVLEQQERGEWIEWRGGDCPTSKRVDVLFRDGEVLKNFNPANLCWDLIHLTADIIAYRVVKQERERGEE